MLCDQIYDNIRTLMTHLRVVLTAISLVKGMEEAVIRIFAAIDTDKSGCVLLQTTSIYEDLKQLAWKLDQGN